MYLGDYVLMLRYVATCKYIGTWYYNI